MTSLNRIFAITDNIKDMWDELVLIKLWIVSTYVIFVLYMHIFLILMVMCSGQCLTQQLRKLWLAYRKWHFVNYITYANVCRFNFISQWIVLDQAISRIHSISDIYYCNLRDIMQSYSFNWFLFPFVTISNLVLTSITFISMIVMQF